MKHFAGIFLLACMGCYTQIAKAQGYGLTTIIKIQSCADSTYISIPPRYSPPTTTVPTTSTGPPMPTSTDPSTTTEAPMPVVPIGGDSGPANVMFWRVNWALAVNGTSIVTAADTTTQEFRLLGFDITRGLVVKNQEEFSGTFIQNYVWSFQNVFDSITWTYKYQLKVNGGAGNNNCLCRRGGAWSMNTCSSNKAVLFNLISA